MVERLNYDLIIVGGGPAGLAAATNAGYERIRTGLVEQHELGGQAGTSAMIENYAGFHEGITGPDLAMNMIKQCERFGTELHAPVHVSAIEATEDGFQVTDDSYGAFGARTVLIAAGVQYARHPGKNIPRFLNRGVFYGSPNLSASYTNQELMVVGAANSAGSAAVRLADCDGCTVHMLVRGSDLEKKMSGRLIDSIQGIDNIEVHTDTDLLSVDGTDRLEKVTVADAKTGEERQMDADQLFLLIGAKPKTRWLSTEVARDEHNFVIAGRDLGDEVRERFEDHCGRQPFAHETSIPGMFVAGDIRSGSIKRVASAAGEGSIVVPEIHAHLGNASNSFAGIQA